MFLVFSLYRKAWLVASASIAEGWGMTLTEAAGCGTPSVATDIAGHRDSVAPNLSGLLARTPREFTEQIASVLTDAELREQLSAGALQHAATFTWTGTALGTFTPLAEDAIRRQKGRR